ncbi:MAG TPA: hypothetical protein VNL38_01600 [Candidatus Nitrosotenuis sp.]|nr:hypothetical protein [Candidatus Nitrosotenuis sp.]
MKRNEQSPQLELFAAPAEHDAASAAAARSEQKFRLMVVRKLTRLETLLKELTGNGQPGRIARLEDKVRAHDRWLWTVAGAGLVAGWLLKILWP